MCRSSVWYSSKVFNQAWLYQFLGSPDTAFPGRVLWTVVVGTLTRELFPLEVSRRLFNFDAS